MSTIRIPTPLRPFTDGADELAVAGATVGELLANLGADHDGLLPRLLDDAGELRRFVNLYLGSRDVRTLDGLATPVAEGDVLSIVPAVAGGCRAPVVSTKAPSRSHPCARACRRAASRGSAPAAASAVRRSA